MGWHYLCRSGARSDHFRRKHASKIGNTEFRAVLGSCCSWNTTKPDDSKAGDITLSYGQAIVAASLPI